MSSPPRFRAAATDDVEPILAFLRELAALEGRPAAAIASAADLFAALFGAARCAEAFVIELDGARAGFALYYPVFSTFQGRSGLYLEDLYVAAPARGRGLGRAAMAHLACLARARGHAFLDWSVMAGNSAAIDFYEALGAERERGTFGYRLYGRAFEALAGGP